MIEGDEDRVCQLIAHVFNEHVAPEYSKSGINKFLSSISSSRLKEFREDEKSFVIVAKEDRNILGMLASSEENHVNFLFVDSGSQHKGIGRQLIENAIKIIKSRNPRLTTITVCSSPNSQKFYEEIGFKATDLEQDDNGLRYTPLKMQLST